MLDFDEQRGDERMKPFKPPSIVRQTPISPQPVGLRPEPPAKRRKLSNRVENDDENATDFGAAQVLRKQEIPHSQIFKSPYRPQPRAVTPSRALNSHLDQGTPRGAQHYYIVLWRKFTTKKNKTWDGDGFLAVCNGQAILKNDSGKEIGRGSFGGPLLPGSELSFAGKEVVIETMVTEQDFDARRTSHSRIAERPVNTVVPTSRVSPPASKEGAQMVPQLSNRDTIPKSIPKAIPKTKFKKPVLASAPQPVLANKKKPVPRHDPRTENALVMKRPSRVPKDKQIVDVVVDPLLSKALREHQRVGVAFLYECVMGLKAYDGEGAILADEMGLGKTLQTIALLWTLLKQNPVYEDPPVLRKALIVCPATLVRNWHKEFLKWLGKDRIGVFVAENNKTRLTDFTRGRAYSVMIIGYELLRNVQDELKKSDCIDIVIADEGHRLKTKDNKAAQAIKNLDTERRIVLSGTPIQNDLTEFYTMVDFVNPGLLNKYSSFKKEFEIPILKSRQPEASDEEIETGKDRSEELASITSMFILRRTSEILSQYLPLKTEFVVFCRPTERQASIYRTIISSPMIGMALGTPAVSLELINVLKKVCNSPPLLLKAGDHSDESVKARFLSGVSPAVLKTPGASGKLQVLDSLLHQIHVTTEEKVVLVSNYTTTLDILANLLNSLSYGYLRLDGTTPTSKRQDLVDRFNRSPRSTSFVFLLSAKAGGVGINLIGASRLILFDLDWNPATDLQAMARIHRDGQKRPCFIYRLLTQGALDEKIFQRQISKTGLADSIVDGKTSSNSFSRDELCDLFSFDESEGCQTHRLLSCPCSEQGMPLEQSDEEQTKPRNDLSTLDQEDTVEVVDLRDDDGVSLQCVLTATQKKRAEIEAIDAMHRQQSKTQAKMASLMQYTHFNPKLLRQRQQESAETEIGLSDVVDDHALCNVLMEDDLRVGFLLTKTSM